MMRGSEQLEHEMISERNRLSSQAMHHLMANGSELLTQWNRWPKACQWWFNGDFHEFEMWFDWYSRVTRRS